jgi:hypothetical protein
MFNLPFAASPTMLTVGWRLTSTQQNMPETFHGSAAIVNAVSTGVTENVSDDINGNVNITSYDFSSVFSDVSDLTGGLYNSILTFTVSHSVYGSFTSTVTRTSAFTVAYADVPGLALITSNWSGRYTSAATNVTVTSRTYNIVTGDRLLYELKSGSVVLYSFTADLTNGSTQSSHAIPSTAFADLTIGVYTITVTSIRDGAQKEVRNITYEAVRPPILHFVSINPNRISLPIETPEEIETLWYVDGIGINSIQGTFELINTNYSVSINKTF